MKQKRHLSTFIYSQMEEIHGRNRNMSGAKTQMNIAVDGTASGRVKIPGEPLPFWNKSRERE